MTETVQLDGKLDLSVVADLHEALLAIRNRDVICDLSGAHQIGALCLQLLLSSAKTAAANGRRFALINASKRVRSQMTLMGIDPDTLSKGTA